MIEKIYFLRNFRVITCTILFLLRQMEKIDKQQAQKTEILYLRDLSYTANQTSK